jgi:hypothetical protein
MTYDSSIRRETREQDEQPISADVDCGVGLAEGKDVCGF